MYYYTWKIQEKTKFWKEWKYGKIVWSSESHKSSYYYIRAVKTKSKNNSRVANITK